jgi:von Willebrand factor type A domain
MSRLLFCAALAAAASSCMTYDFEPVTPIAVAHTTKTATVAALGAKPNVMLLLDKSGSMNNPMVAGCTGACRSRIEELRAAMGPFLSQYGAVARFGLSTFPRGAQAEQCLPPGGVRLDVSGSSDVPGELSAHAADIDAIIQGLGVTETVAGGTPTSASLDVMGTLSSLADPVRANVVVLLTDGQPNCNINNPVTVGNGGTCKCTSNPMFDPYCTTTGVEGCLDEDASVRAVRALAQRKIQTVVIGFGADTNGSALLDQMAFEGGLSRSCKVDADCGAAGPCSQGYCRTRYYQANDGAALAQALRDIVNKIQKPCEYPLGFSPEPNAKLAVLIDGQSVEEDAANTWRYDAATSTVFLTGGLCARAEATSLTNSMQLEIRVLEVVQ